MTFFLQRTLNYEIHIIHTIITMRENMDENTRIIKKKENLVRTTLGKMYPAFTELCKENANVHQKHLLPFFIIHIVNARHILKKWDKKFKIYKNYNPEKLKNVPNMLFQDYTIKGGELVLIVVKLWEKFNEHNFIAKNKMYNETYENVLKFLETNNIGTRLFTKDVEIIDWYNNICEYYSYNTCSTLTSALTQCSLYPCSIKLMMKYNKALSFYDVNRFITVILQHKILHKITIGMLTITNGNPSIATIKNFRLWFTKMIKTCRNLIINSNVGYASICREMMQCCVLSINKCVNLTNKLHDYTKIHTLYDRANYLKNIHREMSANIILANTYLILILIISYQEPEHVKGLNTIVSLGREYGTYCTNGLQTFCTLFSDFINRMTNTATKPRIICEENSIAASVKLSLRILRIYFGVYAINKPKLPNYLENYTIDRSIVLRILYAKMKAKNKKSTPTY